MQLYFNGDSFVAGVELADDILPEYPGLTSWIEDVTIRNKIYSGHVEWIANTYNNKHYLHERSEEHTSELQSH